MERTHDEADVREVCREVIHQEGEAALTFPNVKARLMERAVNRGKEPAAGDRGAILKIIKAVKAELDAARERARPSTAAPDGNLPLADGLAPAWEKVKQIYQHALTESARQYEMGAKLRIQQAESEADARVAELRLQVQTLSRETESHAGELDQLEVALNAERAAVATLTGELAERTRAMGALEEEARSQITHVQRGLEAATAARIISDQRAHEAELAHATVAGEVKLLSGLVERIETEVAQARCIASDNEARAREAERTRDLAQGRLTALEEECARLRARAEPSFDSAQPADADVTPKAHVKEKGASRAGR
jgi:chromosome segregation ATPase